LARENFFKQAYDFVVNQSVVGHHIRSQQAVGFASLQAKLTLATSP